MNKALLLSIFIVLFCIFAQKSVYADNPKVKTSMLLMQMSKIDRVFSGWDLRRDDIAGFTTTPNIKQCINDDIRIDLTREQGKAMLQLVLDAKKNNHTIRELGIIIYEDNKCEAFKIEIQ